MMKTNNYVKDFLDKNLDNLFGKIILCPCNSDESWIVKYIKENVDKIQFELLISANYNFKTKEGIKYNDSIEIVIEKYGTEKLLIITTIPKNKNKFLEFVKSKNCKYILFDKEEKKVLRNGI